MPTFRYKDYESKRGTKRYLMEKGLKDSDENPKQNYYYKGEYKNGEKRDENDEKTYHQNNIFFKGEFNNAFRRAENEIYNEHPLGKNKEFRKEVHKEISRFKNAFEQASTLSRSKKFHREYTKSYRNVQRALNDFNDNYILDYNKIRDMEPYKS